MRSGWLLLVGGAFATSAVVFSFAQGIFHPYYVAELAPFSAALVGATVGLCLRRDRLARIVAPLAIAAGAITELVVLNNDSTQLGWLPVVLIAGCVLAGCALVALRDPRARAAALAGAFALLLIAPATWAVDTLGHTTSGTFPAGGPASAGFGGGGFGSPGGGLRAGRGTFGGPPGGASGFPGAGHFQAPPGGGALPGAGSNTVPGGPPGATGNGFPGAGRSAGGGGLGGGFGGPGGGASTAQTTALVKYTTAHGGGTIGVSSQSGAATAIIATGAKVAGIGGFSGRESQVSLSWLASAVRDGRIRWIVADSTGGGFGRDSRIGASDVMTTVQSVCTAAQASASSATTTAAASSALSNVYDCAGKADALSAAG